MTGAQRYAGEAGGGAVAVRPPGLRRKRGASARRSPPPAVARVGHTRPPSRLPSTFQGPRPRAPGPLGMPQNACIHLSDNSRCPLSSSPSPPPLVPSHGLASLRPGARRYTARRRRTRPRPGPGPRAGPRRSANRNRRRPDRQPPAGTAEPLGSPPPHTPRRTQGRTAQGQVALGLAEDVPGRLQVRVGRLCVVEVVCVMGALVRWCAGEGILGVPAYTDDLWPQRSQPPLTLVLSPGF